MKRTVLYCTALHIAEWLLFLLFDYFEESSAKPGISAAGFVMLPLVSIVVLCLFCAFLQKTAGFKKNWQYPLALAGVWFCLCGIALLAELVLTGNGIYPFRQNNSGWQWFLNGIEYIMFPVFNMIGGGIVLMLIAAFRVIAPHFRKNRV